MVRVMLVFRRVIENIDIYISISYIVNVKETQVLCMYVYEESMYTAVQQFLLTNQLMIGKLDLKK